jgi:hypothetical protein
MTTNTRAHKTVDTESDAQRRREFTHAILNDLRALERMLKEGLFEKGVRRIGAEQEMFLIDQAWGPARGVMQVLEAARPRPPLHHRARPVPARGQLRPAAAHGGWPGAMHRQLDDLIDRRPARAAGAEGMQRGADGHPADHAQGRPGPRQHGAERALPAAQQGRDRAARRQLRVLDQGPRRARHRARLGDARGVQLELPGPLAGRAARVRPLLQHGPAAGRADHGGRHQLADRVRQAAVGRDAHRAVPPGGRQRKRKNHLREARRASASAPAGSSSRSSRSSARTSPASARWWAPSSTRSRWRDAGPRRAPPAQGAAPAQRHHLPVEPGLLRRHRGQGPPAHREPRDAGGPSTLDEVANAALWAGLMVEMAEREGDITRRIDFDDAGNNFYTAAREGLGAHFMWLDGEEHTARNLVLDRLLPVAEAGLRRHKVDAATSAATSASSRRGAAPAAAARAGSWRRGTRCAIAPRRPSAPRRWWRPPCSGNRPTAPSPSGSGPDSTRPR